MKRKYLVYIHYCGMCRDVAIEAYTASQALALAKIQATPLELAHGRFEVSA